jgi:hypothetical protein
VVIRKYVAINIAMNYLVIYPGRFHPFHRGHKASYDWLVKKFGEGSVYIATSDVQNPEDSPFSYSDKVAMTTKLGIPAGHVVQVKNPYQATEITNNLSDEEKQTTALIFAVSQKDTARFNFKPKKDGTPGYLQPLPENLKALAPMTKHGYVAVTPTVNFRVRGVDADSASAVRKMYLAGNDADRNQIITDLYGAPDPDLQAVFDQKLGVNTPENIVTYGAEIIDGGTKEFGESRNIKLKKLSERILKLKQRLKEMRQTNAQDYIDEKISR